MRVLDLCCGLGGWSKGFWAEGFGVVGVDVADHGYPYNFIQADIRNLKGGDFLHFDVIVGSPPCRDFARIAPVGKARWKDPPDPQRGLEVVNAFLRIVEEAQPSIWLMENVVGLERHLKIKPQQIICLAPFMRRAFWGRYPLFLIDQDRERGYTQNIKGKNRSALRAEIPIQTAREFAAACRREIEGL